jgi:hypothetical protein
MSGTRFEKPTLQLLSVIMPARDEEGCVASTVERLRVRINGQTEKNRADLARAA